MNLPTPVLGPRASGIRVRVGNLAPLALGERFAVHHAIEPCDQREAHFTPLQHQGLHRARVPSLHIRHDFAPHRELQARVANLRNQPFKLLLLARQRFCTARHGHRHDGVARCRSIIKKRSLFSHVRYTL